METPRLDPMYRKLHHVMFLQALKILHDEEAAHDIVHDAFIRVLRHIDKLEDKKDPAGWIRRIVTNLCFDELRKRRTAANVGGESLSEVPAPRSPQFEPSYASENEELREALKIGLNKLTPTHLELFLMREFEGLTYAQMAKKVDCPPGTVMSRLFHARKKLQEYLRRGKMAGDIQGPKKKPSAPRDSGTPESRSDNKTEFTRW